ncbi:glycosyltransferase [uncultured Pelagimonas sp.]|uniref:glycosyltransferase family 2 protein n=1 Tax=uncultured Pelagimonas sp. TaxID=1618102 RepID=UPI00261AD42A|nr:glycosyltransferase [uncultured Pelagimonas sp.]
MALPVSVVVVSRGRPQALARCLMGLAQLDYAPFEVIVVTCPDGEAIVSARPDASFFKLVGFDEPNISAARNLGIEQAAGDIVAFIDDDAVPEPLWLTHLTGPFEQPDVSAAGGYVIGRNGISFQWQARTIDCTGTPSPYPLPDTKPAVPSIPNGHALKTEGTNMAFRRSILRELGGFDPQFRFYLDETDLNMRLAQSGQKTAIAPMAQVHHGFAESERRDASRVPKDLTQIGASQRVFLKKYCPEPDQDRAWMAFCEEQRLRLFRFAKKRQLNATQMAQLLRGLQDGGAEGLTRPIKTLSPFVAVSPAFQAFPGRPNAPRVVLAGRIWQARRLRRDAAKLAQSGSIVSLFILLPSPRFHTVSFENGGYWEQFGGRFGRSERGQRFSRYWRFSTRVKEEIARVTAVRG